MSEPLNETLRETIVIAPGRVLPEYLREQAAQTGPASGIERSKWSVLTVLFIVTGAFGLPLLYRSDRFSKLEKFFWAVLVIVYTAALFYAMLLMVRWSIGDALK